MISATKDPTKVRAGKIGARTRWAEHVPRVVRLDELTGPQRRLVLALIAAAKSEETPTVSETSVGVLGARRARDEPSAA